MAQATTAGTAELAAHLEQIHAQRGDSRSSERFGELRRRFQRAAGLTDEEIATAVAAAIPQAVDAVPVEETLAVGGVEEAAFEIPVETVELETLEVPVEQLATDTVPETADAAPEIEIIEETPEIPVEVNAESTEEVDLSSEWSTMLEETAEPSVEAETVAPVESAAPTLASEPAIEEFAISEIPVEAPAAFESAAVHEAAEIPTPSQQESGIEEFELPVETVAAEAEPSGLAEISPEKPAAEHEPVSEEVIGAHTGDWLLPDEELTALPVPEHSEVASEEPEAQLEAPQAVVPREASTRAGIRGRSGFRIDTGIRACCSRA